MNKNPSVNFSLDDWNFDCLSDPTLVSFSIEKTGKRSGTQWKDSSGIMWAISKKVFLRSWEKSQKKKRESKETPLSRWWAFSRGKLHPTSCLRRSGTVSVQSVAKSNTDAANCKLQALKSCLRKSPSRNFVRRQFHFVATSTLLPSQCVAKGISPKMRGYALVWIH